MGGKCRHAAGKVCVKLGERRSIDGGGPQRVLQLTHEAGDVDGGGEGSLARLNSHRQSNSGTLDVLVVDRVGQVDIAVIVIDQEGLCGLEGQESKQSA
jgi:hypothetical protein